MTNLSKENFLLEMAAELRRYGWEPAENHAEDGLKDFLTDEKVEYGDPEFAWDRDAAIALVWELFAE